MSVASVCRCVVFALTVLPAWAADPWPDDLALAALTSEVLERSPELRAAEALVDAARQRPVQVRAWPDPMVSLNYANDGWSPSLGRRDMTTLGVMWSQELPRPGKRALEAAMASLESDQVEQDLERVRRGLRAQTARAYVALLLGREMLELISEQRETWRQIEGVTRTRYAVGQGAQQDVLRVQVEVTRIEQLHARQTAQIAIDLAEINRLRDRDLDAPFDTPARLRSSAGPDEAALLDELRAASPELRAGRLMVEREQAALQLAERQRQPDFSVQAGYMHRGALDPMWQAGVGLRLPLRRAAQRGAMAEAAARRRAAERRLEGLELQLRFHTRTRLTRLRALEHQARLYDDGIVPQDRMSVEAALANYQAGKGLFLTVLEALTTLYGDRSALLELLAEQAVTRVALHAGRLEGGE